MPSNDLISVVVTTYNRSDALVQVLKGLSHQEDSNFEVIVADDGSSPIHQDAIRTAATESGLRITHVWHPDIGFTASLVRNRGVSVSSGAYIVFLDGDCVPEIDFLQQHRRLRESGCLVNGSRVMLSASFTQQIVVNSLPIFGRSASYWMRKRLAGDASKLSGLFRFPDWELRKKKDFSLRGIRSCNMGVWRSDFEMVNGFDESFVGWGHEDADFVLRMHNAGVLRKNGFCATEVFHLWHAESSRLQESKNADRVKERIQTHQVLPAIGFRQSRNGSDMVVHRWE
jgi:GT2 family glycosyltransferase